MSIVAPTLSPVRQRFISLGMVIALVFMLVFTGLFAAFFGWAYTSSTEIALQRIQEDMATTIEGAAAGIDPAELAALGREGEPRADGFSDDPRFWRQIIWLDTVHRIDHHAWPYTYVRGAKPNEILFIADLWAKYDPSKAAKFKESKISTGSLIKGLSEPTEKMTPYDDAWGHWVSAYRPIKDVSGQVVGGIGIDYEASYVLQVQEKVRSTIILAALVSFPLVLVLVLVISRQLTRRIVTLTAATQRIRKGDYAIDVADMARGRMTTEIGRLALVIDTMAQAIRRREENLKQQVAVLRIEVDEAKQRRQVDEITDTDFFRDLERRATRLRRRSEVQKEAADLGFDPLGAAASRPYSEGSRNA